jgi:MFS family permease
MPMAPEPTSDLSHIIQLSVAPVFLLAGIGAFINVLAGRLGRIFDRSRVLEAAFDTSDSAGRQAIMSELEALGRRAKLAYLGITLDIIAALFVCLLIAIAFAEHFFGFETRGVIGGLFIASMLALIGGLIAFLREVFVAVKSLSSWLSNRDM